MAKNSEAKGRAGTPLPAADSKSTDGAQGTARPTTKLKSSSLLDTRVVYCGDNLEQLAKLPDACARQMMKEECSMIKPTHSLFLHSSFILLPSPVTASHYVKVMLDQIFGENNFNN